MPTLPSLRKTFQRALATAVVAGPSLSACIEPGIQHDPDFVPAHCEGGQNVWLNELKPEPPVDLLELVSFGMTLERHGEACKTASLVAACEAELSALRANVQSGFDGLRLFTGQDHFGSGALLFSRGDQVGSVASSAALVSLLGKIDTPEEAMFVAQSAGYNVECNGGGARPSDEGFDVQAYLGVGCGGLSRYLLAVGSDGKVEKIERTRIKDPQPNCEVGRRPAGLCAPAQAPCRSPGDYLARAALLEAASVEAFRRLAAELALHGAPQPLIDAALAAARDEIRHARVTSHLARRLGARPQRPIIEDGPLRALEAIASENAVEGCVRETFGALQGRFMAMHAGDSRVRRAFRRIAEDELRHAALSWRVARWIEPRLGPSAKKRVSALREEALLDLHDQLGVEASQAIQQVCGVPSAQAGRRLFAALAPSLS